MSRYQGTPEGAIQSSILEYLSIEKIWHCRMQSRTFQVPGKGGKLRPMFVGTVGMADILAIPKVQNGYVWGVLETIVLWIECKAGKGRQSAAQKEFEDEVCKAGHYYLVAHSIDDVRDWLKSH